MYSSPSVIIVATELDKRQKVRVLRVNQLAHLEVALENVANIP